MRRIAGTPARDATIARDHRFTWPQDPGRGLLRWAVPDPSYRAPRPSWRRSREATRRRTGLRGRSRATLQMDSARALEFGPSSVLRVAGTAPCLSARPPDECPTGLFIHRPCGQGGQSVDEGSAGVWIGAPDLGRWAPRPCSHTRPPTPSWACGGQARGCTRSSSCATAPPHGWSTSEVRRARSGHPSRPARF